MYKNEPMKLDPSMQLVPTSFDGIFAKVRSPENVAEPMSIAPLIHSSVLARLQEADTPAARIFRDKVLYRHWRPRGPDCPFVRSAERSHAPANSRDRATNTAFTSGNWAGSTINGPWTAAFGIWRVPAVTRPTIQAGTSGGWASSSWVGIDGASADASTDVLQAGVRQQVSAGGGASYFAWFEWFIPKELRTPDSPRYVLETPIDNIQIEPGDEVFSAIYYVGRQGEIMFGNIDRGHYFSMVLEPPKGASFNGASAEWIMEAPDTGEPGTSLPSFTPVVFTTAFSNGRGVRQETRRRAIRRIS